MAALLSCEMESTERISEHVDDARRMKIEMLGPDINRSEVEFGFADGKITFGLAALKGVGGNVVQAIVEERNLNGPFKDIFNLTERVDPKVLTKGTLETLIKAGVLDSLPGTRAQQSAVVERAVQSAVSRQKDKARGQKSLFGGDDDEETDSSGSPIAMSFPDVPDWTHTQKLAWEKETIGFYLTSHPLTQHARRIERYAANKNSELAEMEEAALVTVGGMISAIKLANAKKPSRNGHSRYANFDLEDPTGIVRCIAWPEDYARYEELIKTESVIIVAGKVDRRGREPNLVVNRIFTLDQADKEFTTQVAIKFEKGLHSYDDIQRVRNAISRYPGPTDVILIVDSFAENARNGATKSNGTTTANGNGHADDDTEDTSDDKPDSSSGAGSRLRYILTTGNECKVNVGPELLQALSDIVGEANYDLKAAKTRRPTGQSVGR
jgi:DNA polymerase-3 subunit alpha